MAVPPGAQWAAATCCHWLPYIRSQLSHPTRRALSLTEMSLILGLHELDECVTEKSIDNLMDMLCMCNVHHPWIVIRGYGFRLYATRYAICSVICIFPARCYNADDRWYCRYDPAWRRSLDMLPNCGYVHCACHNVTWMSRCQCMTDACRKLTHIDVRERGSTPSSRDTSMSLPLSLHVWYPLRRWCLIAGQDDVWTFWVLAILGTE